ncbi:MAG TPA: hypothetical protein VJA21_00915, partial [Verrucomicrobiae bacterium]
SFADFEEQLPEEFVKSRMRALPFILTLAVVAGIVSSSCRSDKSVEAGRAGPAHGFGSTEFVKHTPPQFHQLKLGMTEEAMVETVGKPGHVSSLWPPGQMDKSAGKRCSYSLEEGGGVVWVDLDTDSHVTGIYWRDRD